MTTRNKLVAQGALLMLLIIGGFVLFGKAIADLSMFLVSVFFLPAAIAVLGWFVFSVWGRTYLRAWHIRRIRNARYLREAVERGRTGA
jgi:hypothetical protein